jgi:hypothetical protein
LKATLPGWHRLLAPGARRPQSASSRFLLVEELSDRLVLNILQLSGRAKLLLALPALLV